MKPKVLIFTKRVLPMSNTFVAAQGNNLPTYQPVYVGLRNNTSGISLIKGHETCVQENASLFPAFSRLLLDGAQILTPNWRQQLSNVDAKVIHAHFGKGGYYCSPIAKKLDLPMITTFHGSDITQKGKLSYNQKHRKITYQNSSKIIAVSKFIQNKLIERGCPEDKIIQHYIGMDNQYFSPCQDKYSEPTILFVGRLIEQKGCQYLLQAMKTVNAILPEAKLIIAGYGNYQKILTEQASSLKNITFVGAQDRKQVKDLMSKSWVTCLPSIRMARGNEEGMPTVCMESQAVGTPVVAFDTGGVSESVIDQVTGLLSPQKDQQQLADNLLQVLQNTTLRQKMATAGIERVNKYFNIRTQCKKLEDIYNSVR
ncbi:glycosyltransferase [Colwellia sp. E2M01]|uniref:glycosyltransferase n=1 Tax=Colwellia sp. E2M01 TaxID=2841561 RepID=UPI001C08A279|nr:glycosyltransferase [Colwellia sp. E2M01]MBU2870992.1 glycosyltransferase [Colwellia sp. E2M01]